jgi:hypothetical protein
MTVLLHFDADGIQKNEREAQRKLCQPQNRKRNGSMGDGDCLIEENIDNAMNRVTY